MAINDPKALFSQHGETVKSIQDVWIMFSLHVFLPKRKKRKNNLQAKCAIEINYLCPQIKIYVTRGDYNHLSFCNVDLSRLTPCSSANTTPSAKLQSVSCAPSAERSVHAALVPGKRWCWLLAKQPRSPLGNTSFSKVNMSFRMCQKENANSAIIRMKSKSTGVFKCSPSFSGKGIRLRLHPFQGFAFFQSQETLFWR